MTVAIQGGEWTYDEDCDCPLCTDYRDSHCPKCGAEHVAKMRVPGDEVCFPCRYPEDQ